MNHLALLPIVIPLSGALISLALRRRHAVQQAWSVGALVASLAASALLLYIVWSTGRPVVFQLGGWAAPFGITIMADSLGAFMAVMVQLVMACGALYAAGAKDQCTQYPTFFPLFLLLATALTGTMLTGDIFNLFVFAELMVAAGAALTAISDDKYGPEAALKYFYISLFGGFFLLIACGSLYVSYGTLNMADLGRRIAADPNQPLVGAAMVFLIGFFMIKSAVVPFHFWQPDFHTVAPTAVSAMLSSVVVKLGVYGFIRMTTLLFVPQAELIRAIALVAGVVGVVFGGLSALGTHNAKRMLAYSTLAQIGFILVGIGIGTPFALAAALIFTFNHSLVKSAMLMLAGYLASRAPVKTASFDAIRGIGKAMPGAGLLFFLGGMALAGVPPTNGFISKALVFAGSVASEQYAPLAIIGFASIITLLYVMRAFSRVWWEPKPEDAKVKPHGDRLVAPAILIGLCVALGVAGEPLLRLATDIAAWLGDASNYIGAVLGS